MVVVLNTALPFFIKNGKKNITENNIFNFLRTNYRKKVKVLKIISEKKREDFNVKLNLKSFRRGKHTIYHAFVNKYEIGQKKFYLDFAKGVSENKGKSFSSSLHKELGMLSKETSTAFKKRNEIYMKALKISEFLLDDDLTLLKDFIAENKTTTKNRKYQNSLKVLPPLTKSVPFVKKGINTIRFLGGYNHYIKNPLSFDITDIGGKHIFKINSLNNNFLQKDLKNKLKKDNKMINKIFLKKNSKSELKINKVTATDKNQFVKKVVDLKPVDKTGYVSDDDSWRDVPSNDSGYEADIEDNEELGAKKVNCIYNKDYIESLKKK